MRMRRGGSEYRLADKLMIAGGVIGGLFSAIITVTTEFDRYLLDIPEPLFWGFMGTILGGIIGRIIGSKAERNQNQHTT